MVNNSPSINKMNNYLSPQILEYIKKRPQHMMLEIQVLAWDRHNNVSGLNWFMGYQHSSLDN